MTAKRRAEYVEFPVILLRGAATGDIHEICYEIMCFAAYKMTLHLKFNDSFGKMKSASELFSFNYKDIEASYEKGEKIYRKIKYFFPLVKIKPDIMIDFIEIQKTQFEIDCFLAYCALKSIIQLDPFKRVTKKYLFSRMMGFAKSDQDIQLPETLKKYETRYHFDKLKYELQITWNVKIYSFRTHGFYISFVFPQERLVYEAEKLRKKNVEKRLRDQNEAARIKALEQLNLTAH